MKLHNYSKIFLGLLSALACTAPVLGHPKFINEWAAEIRSVVASRNLKIDPSKNIEELLHANINLDNFDVTCSALLQSIVKEQVTGSELSFLNIDSALDICALINPWNSMECGGVTGVAASYARSIQEFVRAKDPTKGDLRAACVIASAISPGRPFSPIAKGSIKSKCEEVCSGDISKTISSIDSSFCNLSIDLCSAVDFTNYNAFSSLDERELGIAVATSVLLSEGSLGLRTSYREGCRYVLSLKQKGTLPRVPSDVSEPIILSSITEFYKNKLSESGLLLPTNDGSGSSESVFLKVLVSQISKATKTILEAQFSKKPVTTTTTPRAARLKKTQVASTYATSSEVSPLSDAVGDPLSSESTSHQDVKGLSGISASNSPALESWFYVLKDHIKRGTKDIDADFDDALNQVVSRIDSSAVYSSCVSELKRFNLVSHRRAVEACRKIDPFSSSKCQKLNHFELMFLVRLREDLERYGRNLVVDLKDLCAVSQKMSLESFLMTRTVELSSICIRVLQKSIRNKYHISDRVIKKACTNADYLRTSSCGNLISSQYHERINIVSSLAVSLFDKRNDKERLQAARDSEFRVPSYPDLCNAVEKLPVETVEDCVFELRDSLSKFKSIIAIINIEEACIYSLETQYDLQPFFGRDPYGRYEGTGRYGRYDDPSLYPDYQYPQVRDLPIRGLRRFYRHIEHSPMISSLPWIRGELPQRLKYSGKYVEQEYSESRRGYYKDAFGKTVFHDGNRYLMNGVWFIKVGQDWYIDHSTAADFVRILPGDPRYNPHPIYQYDPKPGPDGVLIRRTFATYISPSTPAIRTTRQPSMAPGYDYTSYYRELYGRPSYPGGVTPHYAQPIYKRCKKCMNWVPYGHDHDHDRKEAEARPQHDIHIKDSPTYDPFTGLYITRQSYYDSTKGLVSSSESASSTPSSLPVPGTREVGVQVDSSSSSGLSSSSV